MRNVKFHLEKIKGGTKIKIPLKGAKLQERA